MTTKTEKYDHGIDLQGLPLINAPIHPVSSLPATTYARIVYLTTDFTYYSYDTNAAAWVALGSGAGVVASVVAGNGIDIDATDPSNPIVIVDETELAVPEANVTGLVADLALKAPLASPVFTGNPTAPTQTAGNNSTRVATTAYADGLVADAINDGTTAIAPSQNAVFDALALKAPLASPALTGTPTAPTAAGTTNTTQVATTAMVQAALAAYIAAQDALVFKGVIDCSANPNYPAADAGHVYKVSVAGKIGGASGVPVEVGDVLTCIVDSSTSGNQATVGANWIISQVNIDGAVTGPVSATADAITLFNGTTGKIVKDSGVALSALATLASPTFTGNPLAPTPSAGDNDTSIATTAFVQTAIGARSYTALIGDGSTEDITINHALNGYPSGVAFFTVSGGGKRSVYWEYVDANNIKVWFPTGAPPATNSIRTVIGL